METRKEDFRYTEEDLRKAWRGRGGRGSTELNIGEGEGTISAL